MTVPQTAGHLYAAINSKPNCRLEGNIRLVELGPEFEIKSIFQTNNVSSVDVGDFVVTPDYFLMVGGIRTFLPTTLTKETKGFQNIIEQNLWDESIWEKGDGHSNAFILVIRKDGTLLADKIFPDLLNRGISNVAAITPNHFLAVGSAFGDHGWVFAFSLRGPSSNFLGRFESWLKWIWGSVR